MQISDHGVILEARAHGETHAIANIFSRDHGRWTGLVHGGQGRRMGPLLQPGNEVAFEWKGRGDDSLGHFSLEMIRARAAEALGERRSLAALSAACATALVCLPEREAHRPSYEAMLVYLDNLEDVEVWPALLARWELGLLAALGFALTLDRCAATGGDRDLAYVSPKSACAVSAEAGEPYKDKLLRLPGFLKGEGGDISAEDAIDGLRLTGYFIETRILHLSNRQLPEARQRIMKMLEEAAAAE
ncbi:MAG: DNA repair protein RecO [Pseudomonadota bacterium]